MRGERPGRRSDPAARRCRRSARVSPNIGGDVLLASGGARSRLAQKGLRAVHPNGPLRSRYAREKPRGETGTASQVKRQPWTVSHGWGDEGLTGRIEDFRDAP